MGQKVNAFVAAILLLGFVTLSSADPVQYKAGGGRKYPTISMDDAEIIALKAQPGKVVFKALKGKPSSRAYVFTILNHRIVYQVFVDARDGHIVRIKQKAGL